ncbi:MAG: hypothetical protein H6799_01740 [Candidatus Nomurabacteria bacterium]|nr:MAG: hypothetical protein H6799_01740 [Candidatus Nomurabacteria bacterium]HRV75911.1 hypothetical protein [Candidatus Saccharimonadales bacterium]
MLAASNREVIEYQDSYFANMPEEGREAIRLKDEAWKTSVAIGDLYGADRLFSGSYDSMYALGFLDEASQYKREFYDLMAMWAKVSALRGELETALSLATLAQSYAPQDCFKFTNTDGDEVFNIRPDQYRVNESGALALMLSMSGDKGHRDEGNIESKHARRYADLYGLAGSVLFPEANSCINGLKKSELVRLAFWSNIPYVAIPTRPSYARESFAKFVLGRLY